MAQYYQHQDSNDDAVVLTPATRAGFGGAEDGDASVYVIPIAEAVPLAKKNKRRRQEDGVRTRDATGSDSIATLDSVEEGSWRETLFGSCCAASPTYWLRAVCCPCATAAAVNERLGSSYELALLYFGVLASGMFVCTGLAITYDQTNRKHHRHHDHGGFPPQGMGDDWMNSNNSSFGSGFDSASWPPPPPRDDDVSLGKNPEFWAGLTVACLLLFLLGVWLLRDQTRKRLSIRGTKLGDLIVSFVCCCCALGQMDLELSQSKLANKRKKERRRGQQQHEQGAELEAGTAAVPVVTVATTTTISASTAREPRHDTADTLAAYPTAALV